MIIKVNLLRNLQFQDAGELYAYLVDIVNKGIMDLDKDDFTLQRVKWKILSNNFNLTDEEMQRGAITAMAHLNESKNRFFSAYERDNPDLLQISRIWLNTLISVFFIIEPDIIANNPGPVEDLWEFFYKAFSRRDNAITFLNITKI